MLNIVVINVLFVVMKTFFIVIHGQNETIEAFFVVLNFNLLLEAIFEELKGEDSP